MTKTYFVPFTSTFLLCTALALLPFINGCTDTGTAQRVLQQNGYKDISIEGYAFFSCGKDDWYSTKFEATSPNGSHVEGAVCSGLLFKNATIRFR